MVLEITLQTRTYYRDNREKREDGFLKACEDVVTTSRVELLVNRASWKEVSRGRSHLTSRGKR